MRKFIKKIGKNWKSIIFYLLIFLLFMYEYTILFSLNCDNIWNYGFAYNIVNGMIPYKDFNILLFPLAPFIISLFMKIFGTKMLVYYGVSALFMTASIWILNKIEKSVSPIVLIILFLFSAGGYNALLVTLILLLIYLERNKVDDIWIGIVIGLLILTKQVMGILLIPIFMTKDLKKIIKRIMGIIIPCQFFLLYLVKNEALYDCINYTLLALFEFGSNNGNITFWTFIAIYIFAFWIYKYIKTKDLNCIYGLCFLAIAAPIFDMYHTCYAAIPFVIYSCATKGKIQKFVSVFFSMLLIIYAIDKSYTEFSDKNSYYELNNDSNYYLILTKNSVVEYSNDVYQYYQSHINEYDIYFLDNNIYYVKLEHNIPINKFDLFLNGNNGYDGTNKLKEKIKNMKKKTLFIVDERVFLKKGQDKFDQTNFELIEFVINNYEKIDSINEMYNVYEIVNE